jgi:SAM-dependent methyltransferase
VYEIPEGVTKLHIGCGRTRIPDAVNVDISSEVSPDVVWDVESRDARPLPDNSFDSILMSHVLEHLRFPLVAMENLWHLAKPGGKILIKVPYGSSDNAFEDPTHVRQYFLHSWDYFSQASYGGADYGYRGDWKIHERILKIKPHWNPEQFENDLDAMLEIINTHRNTVEEMSCVLEAVKPIREAGTFTESAPILFELPQRLGVAA